MKLKKKKTVVINSWHPSCSGFEKIINNKLIYLPFSNIPRSMKWIFKCLVQKYMDSIILNQKYKIKDTK